MHAKGKVSDIMRYIFPHCIICKINWNFEIFKKYSKHEFLASRTYAVSCAYFHSIIYNFTTLNFVESTLIFTNQPEIDVSSSRYLLLLISYYKPMYWDLVMF